MALQCPKLAVLLQVLLLLLAASASTSAAERKTQFTIEDKKEIVVTHNRLRQASYPTAIAMNFVVWNCHLEEKMTKAARQCTFEHTEQVGENIYKGTRGPVEVTMAWYSEKHNYNHATSKCEKGICGHYTQVMSEAVTEIGCGIHWCKNHNAYLVYCGYNAGNGFYNNGFQPCSSCYKEMPFCLNGLCVSKELAAAAVVKDVDSTASAKSAECKLVCHNCGTRVDKSGECKCDCKSGTSGHVCQYGKTTATCSLCKETPPCENGGTVDTSDTTKCKCTCTGGFGGDRCEIPKDVFGNSVKLVLATKDAFKYNGGTYVVMPAVSRALFNSKIWTNLQTKVSSAVNAFCREKSETFVQCCPGKTFPGAAKVTSTAHISAKDVQFTESSFKNSKDGSLHLLVHAKVSNSALCAVTGTTSRKKRSVPAAKPEYLKQDVLLKAVKAANINITSPELKAGYQTIMLKEVEAPPKTAVPEMSLDLIRNVTLNTFVKVSGNGTYECGSFPMPPPPPPAPKIGNCPIATLLPWPVSLLLLLVFSFRV